MKNKFFYRAVLVAFMLGMTACADGKGDKALVQTGDEDGKLGTQQEMQGTGQGVSRQDGQGQSQDVGQGQAEAADESGLQWEESGQAQQGGQRQQGEQIQQGEKGEQIQQGEKEEQGGQIRQEGDGKGNEEADDADGAGLDGNLYVYFEDEAKEYKAEDGTVLLTVETRFPVVVISDNDQAAGAINDYVRGESPFDEESMFGLSRDEAVEWAKEDYERRGKENWVAQYDLLMGYALERMDSRVISFVVSEYSYMGGAHPNSYSKGLTFDTQTGKRLELGDVVKEEGAASAAVLEFLLAETKKAEYGDVLFFADYEKYLEDLLAEDTWYLGEDGFHIIANAYSIAPYVAGDFDFVIPYGQADFMKDEYR